MSNEHPNRRAALILPSKRKHILMALASLAFGFALPVLYIAAFGDAKDAQSEGAQALAPLPQVEPVAPLNNERLDTPDLLAGDVPEGVNPTEVISPPTESQAALENVVETTPEPKRIEVPQNPNALPKAPIAGLTRQSKFGPIPVKGSNSVLKAYRRPFERQAGKTAVSLIIGGLGVNRGLTQDAIEILPADVTLSFAAHSTGLQGLVDAARADGHEVLLEIPMDSASFDPSEPGADKALLTTIAPIENGQRLDWMMSRAQGYAGLINFNGDIFLTRSDIAGPYLDHLEKSGVGFFTDGDFETPALAEIAQSKGQPFKNGNGLIDPHPVPRVIAARLKSLSQTAKSGTHPVGVGFVYPETLAEVKAWIETLEGQNLQLAPATAALK